MSESDSTEEGASRARLAAALFSPATVALIGASDDPGSILSRPQRLLKRHGYRGRIVAIHPMRADIAGQRAYPSAAAVPGGVDHALIMTPAPAVASAMRDCGAAGVKVATVFSAGFAETGERGRRRQDQVVAAARAAGVRILGPNSLGAIDVSARFALCANSVLEHEPLRPGGLALVSQSGSMLGAILTRAQERGLGFSRLVSTGNECDIASGEIVHMLVDDPATQAILLFVETIGDARVLAAAARRAFAAGKPIIAYKVGRSAAGRELAASHTGALTTDERTAQAFFRAHGIVHVEVLDALFESVPLVLGSRPPAGRRRIGAVTVSAGAAATVIDRLGLAGVEMTPPPADVIERLSARRIRIGSSAVIDLPMGRADGGAYAQVVDELLASDHCELVLAVLGSNAAHEPQSVRDRILATRNRGRKPLAVFAAPRAAAALELLQAHALAAFRTPEACADAIRAYLDWRSPEPVVGVPEDATHAIRAAISRATGHRLNELEAAQLLTAAGIPFAPGVAIRDATEKVDLPFPVAAKLLSPDIAHKTEAGAVVLDLADPAALAGAVTALLEHARARLPGARVDGVLVQTMQRGSFEAIVGFRRDPQLGPLVLVGPGGAAAELAAGHAVHLAPVSLASAGAMIEEAPGLAPWRKRLGAERAGLDALARALHRLSLLACDERVVEAEINPLLVSRKGAVGVDALIRLRDLSERTPPA